jgi:hypothetical protein
VAHDDAVSKQTIMTTPNARDRESFSYAPLYCEENVWHLAQSEALGAERRCVAFVTNSFRRCALFHQRAAAAPHEPVVWDYHVILLVERAGWEVWDLDSALPFPSRAEDYLDATFPRDTGLPAALAPRFRVLDARAYCDTLASDRSHMRRSDGGWHAPPPPWPPILPPGIAPNLGRFLDLEREFVGDVLDLPTLRARFARQPGP